MSVEFAHATRYQLRSHIHYDLETLNDFWQEENWSNVCSKVKRWKRFCERSWRIAFHRFGADVYFQVSLAVAAIHQRQFYTKRIRLLISLLFWTMVWFLLLTKIITICSAKLTNILFPRINSYSLTHNVFEVLLHSDAREHSESKAFRFQRFAWHIDKILKQILSLRLTRTTCWPLLFHSHLI